MECTEVCSQFCDNEVVKQVADSNPYRARLCDDVEMVRGATGTHPIKDVVDFEWLIS